MAEKENDVLSSLQFDETNPPVRERTTTFVESNPPSRERNPTSRQSNPSSRQSNPSSRESTNPPPSRESTFSQQKKRRQSVYSQRQRIKPLDIEAIIEAQKRISLNQTYIKKYNKNTNLHDRLNEKVKLTKACHRPVTVPLVKIVGRIPGYVDVSELQGLRREFEELQKDYHKIVERRRYHVHRRHVELMEIDKITSTRLKNRFIQTLKAYGISANVISDVLAEFQ